MSELQCKFAPGAAKDATTKRPQRQIKMTDKQIDALVYEPYGLSEEELAVVEGAPVA